MSESSKKKANIVATVLTWAAVVGAVASAALSQFAGAGLEVPAVVGAILAVVVTAGRIASRVLLTPAVSESVAAVMLALLAAASAVPPAEPGAIPEPPSIIVPDAVQPVDQGGGDTSDGLDGYDAGPFARGVSSGALAILGLLPVGCSAAQQQVWAGAATKLGQCLAALGVAKADDLVTSWMGGEAVDAAAIGWGLLPGFLDCAMKFGVVVYSGLSQPAANLPDSVGAAMTPHARMLTVALSEDFDPLTAQCGSRDAPPQCQIVLYVK